MSTAAVPRTAQLATSIPETWWWLPFVILLVGHLPFAGVDLATTWTRPHYQFFPFAFAAFVVLLWTRQGSPRHRPRILGVLLLVDCLLLIAAAVMTSPWLAMVGLWVVCLAAAGSRTDKVTGRSLAYLAVLPLLAVRLPANTDLLIVQNLQDFTSRVASRVLNDIGCLHLREGNIIRLPSRDLLVEEACSGIQSLFTLLFLAVLICCWKRRRPVHAVLTIGSAMVFAELMNVVRVTSIALAWEWWRFDLTTGLSHDVLGYTVLVLAAGLVYNFDIFVSGFTGLVPDFDRLRPDAEYRNPFAAAFNRLIGSPDEDTGYRPCRDRSVPITSRYWKAVLTVSIIVSVVGVSTQAAALLNRSGQPTGPGRQLTASRPDRLHRSCQPQNG